VTLIEANGATKTEELLGRLTTDHRLARYTLPLQVTIVDAKRWQKRWWHNALEVNQTRTATHVHVNWAEHVSDDRRAAVNDGIRTLNPHAALGSPIDFVDALERLAVASADDETRPTVAAPRTEGHHHHHPGHAHAHEHPFASVVLGLPETVSRDAFLAFIRALPRAVVRAKGLVRFADQPDAMFVWNRVDGRKVVSLDRSVPHATSQPVALFIGVGLPVDELRAGVESLGA
jgi:G3E family GTPase